MAEVDNQGFDLPASPKDPEPSLFDTFIDAGIQGLSSGIQEGIASIPRNQELREAGSRFVESQGLASFTTQQAIDSEVATITSGGEVAAQGALLTAYGFRQSAESVRQATKYNLETDKVNLQRKLKATSRQYQRVLGRQLAQQGGTGLSIGSKSFLALRNETADALSRTLLNTKVDAENTRRSLIFESQLKRSQLQHQTTAATFQAETERFIAATRARDTQVRGQIALHRINTETSRAQQQVSRQAPSLGSTVLGSVQGAVAGAAGQAASQGVSTFLTGLFK